MLDMFERILQAFNIKDYDSLSPDEKTTILGWVDKIEKSAVTVDDVKSWVINMRQTVEAELTLCDLNYNKDLFLKARLRNLVLLENLLSRPEKARQALENYINRAKTNPM